MSEEKKQVGTKTLLFSPQTTILLMTEVVKVQMPAVSKQTFFKSQQTANPQIYTKYSTTQIENPQIATFAEGPQI